MKGLFVRSIAREKKNGSGARRPIMVIYETTHHETLPALLDLCEARFLRVIVFLKSSSWENLFGQQGPSDRWPKTEFIQQPEGSPNRPFIRRLFAFLRRERCSHLHLSTLDNNLLVFALRMGMARGLHVSLTIHDVNAWFTDSYRSLRSISESLAKRFLRSRIQHYSFLLPAIAETFSHRMPEAVTVFIPSRFYEQPISRSPRSSFTIVVPGSVEPNRRDYDAIAAFFASWIPPRPVRLVLLGNSDSAYGNAVVARLRQIDAGRLMLIHYKGYVPETLYERHLRDADLIWSPLRLHKKGRHGESETYSRTTASGLTGDLLLNHIPALVPGEFDVPLLFQEAFLRYSSADEIASILDRLLADNEWLENLRRDIHAAFSFFRKENFYDAFDRLTGSDDPREKG